MAEAPRPEADELVTFLTRVKLERFATALQVGRGDANSERTRGPGGPLSLAILQGSYILPVESARDLVEVTHQRPPWLTGS